MRHQRIDDYRWDPGTFRELAVLCFVVQDGRVLLMRKKRGLGSGKINGPGGRLEPDEDYLGAAVRETEEELGITPIGPVEAAHLSFIFTDGYSLDARAFIATGYRGELTETDEGAPLWFSVTDIPYHEMWADDRLWLPLVLDGAYVRGRFLFEEDTMLDHAVESLGEWGISVGSARSSEQARTGSRTSG